MCDLHGEFESECGDDFVKAVCRDSETNVSALFEKNAQGN